MCHTFHVHWYLCVTKVSSQKITIKMCSCYIYPYTFISNSKPNKSFFFNSLIQNSILHCIILSTFPFHLYLYNIESIWVHTLNMFLTWMLSWMNVKGFLTAHSVCTSRNFTNRKHTTESCRILSWEYGKLSSLHHNTQGL